MTVVCHTEYIFIAVSFHNAACLSNTSATPDVHYMEFTIIVLVFFLQKCLSCLLYSGKMVHSRRKSPQDFRIIRTILNHSKNRFTLLLTLTFFLR